MKTLIFRKFTMNVKIKVACTVKEPHIVEIDHLLLAGVEPQSLPYGFCPKHNLYFGISATVDMEGQVITFTDYRGNAQ